MKGKMIGLIPSGPGDFFALKPVNALARSLFGDQAWLLFTIQKMRLGQGNRYRIQ